jgi:acyl-CoA thioester hydrolase
VPPFHHRIRVRYNECDQQNAVFNANYLIYIDVTLTEMWREAFGAYEAMSERGLDLVVAEANVRYLAPARFDDELDIAATIERIGTTSLTTRFDITRRDGSPIVIGHLRHVFIAVGSGGKTPIPDDVRTTLERYLETVSL